MKNKPCTEQAKNIQLLVSAQDYKKVVETKGF